MTDDHATWGGARAGAGRKSKATAERQLGRRDRLDELVTDEVWDHVIGVAIEDAIAGEPNLRWRARDFIAAYVAGAKPRGDTDAQRAPTVNVINWTPGWAPPGHVSAPVPTVIEDDAGAQRLRDGYADGNADGSD